MTDRYGDPSYDGADDPYADEPEEPPSRMSQFARQCLAEARAKLGLPAPPVPKR